MSEEMEMSYFIDHLGICLPFYAAGDTETMDDVWSNPKAIAGEWFVRLDHTKPTRPPERLQEWEGNGTGKIAHKSASVVLLILCLTEYLHHSGIEAVMKVRLTAGQLASTGCAFQSRWDSFFQHRPDKPVGIIGSFSG